VFFSSALPNLQTIDIGIKRIAHPSRKQDSLKWFSSERRCTSDILQSSSFRKDAKCCRTSAFNLTT